MGQFIRIGDSLIRKDSILSVEYTETYSYPYKKTQVTLESSENTTDSKKKNGFLNGLFGAITTLSAVTGALSGDYSFEMKPVQFLKLETSSGMEVQRLMLYNDPDFAESIRDIIETGSSSLGKMRNASGATDYERACVEFISDFDATFCYVEQNLNSILDAIAET